jgi:transcriptional regulator with XRE-family HTH domain
MQLTINPRFEGALPALSGEELKLLEESLINEGCRDSIIVWGETIVDGHHRYRICTENNIPFNVAYKEFGDEDAALAWIWLYQAGKRNMDKVDLARLVLKSKDILAVKARERQLAALKQNAVPPNLGAREDGKLTEYSFGETRDELAKIAGISHGTLAKVERVDREAPAPLRAAMGKVISIDKAAKINTALKDVPETEREAEAEKLIDAETQKWSDGQFKQIDADMRVYKKLREIITIGIKYREYGTEEEVEQYIVTSDEPISETAESIDVTIGYLQDLKARFLSKNTWRLVK